MAPKLNEYSAWRLGMLKRQVSLYADHGIHEFYVSNANLNSRSSVTETLCMLDELRESSRNGTQIGTLRVRPVIGKR